MPDHADVTLIETYNVHVNNIIKGLLPRCLTLGVGETLQIKWSSYGLMGKFMVHLATEAHIHVLLELSVAVNAPTGLRELYEKVDVYAKVNDGRFCKQGHLCYY